MHANLLEPQRQPADEDVLPASILVVDDDEAMCQVLAERLTRQGYDLLVAHTGAEGLAKARIEQPRLILLDLRLPDMDGLAVCEELADGTETCDIPVIILSGMERPDIIRRSRAAGCHCYLRKPYDPNALLILIQHAMGESRQWSAAF